MHRLCEDLPRVDSRLVRSKFRFTGYSCYRRQSSENKMLPQEDPPCFFKDSPFFRTSTYFFELIWIDFWFYCPRKMDAKWFAYGLPNVSACVQFLISSSLGGYVNSDQKFCMISRGV